MKAEKLIQHTNEEISSFSLPYYAYRCKWNIFESKMFRFKKWKRTCCYCTKRNYRTKTFIHWTFYRVVNFRWANILVNLLPPQTRCSVWYCPFLTWMRSHADDWYRIVKTIDSSSLVSIEYRIRFTSQWNWMGEALHFCCNLARNNHCHIQCAQCVVVYNLWTNHLVPIVINEIRQLRPRCIAKVFASFERSVLHAFITSVSYWIRTLWYFQSNLTETNFGIDEERKADEKLLLFEPIFSIRWNGNFIERIDDVCCCSPNVFRTILTQA